MAPTPDDAAHLTAPIRRLYEDAERGLVGRIARAVGRGKGTLGAALARMFGLNRAARKIVSGLDAKVRKQLPPLVVEAYEIGADEAAREVGRLRHAEHGPDHPVSRRSDHLPGPADPDELARRLVAIVHPQILRTTDDVYRRIVAEVYAPALAEGRPRLEASQRALDRFASEGVTGFTDRAGRRWSLPAYAEMALRTSFARAAVAGALDRYRADGIDLVGVPDIPMGCPLCEPWEGKILALREGVTPPRGIRVAGTVAEATARGLFHPNCFPGDVLVSVPTGVRAADSRRYEGQIVVIHTAGGQELPVTPNHPVLTPEGWVAAGLLHVGQKVVRHLDPERVSGAVRPNDRVVPARIRDVFEALSQASTMRAVSVPAAPEQFHGDGTIDGHVDVVWADGLLQHDFMAGRAEAFAQLDLLGSGVGEFALLPPGATGQVLLGADHASDRLMGGPDLRGPLLCRHGRPLAGLGLAPTDRHSLLDETAAYRSLSEAELGCDLNLGRAIPIHQNCFVEPGWPWPSRSGLVAASAHRNAGALESLGDDNLGAPVAVGDLLRGLAREVATTDIIEINTRNFSGHVYNLQAGDGWYIASGLIVSNCRHALVPITDRASVAALGNPRPDPAGYKATQQQRALERRIRTAKLRLVVAQESGADAATLRTRRKAVTDRQTEIRSFLRAHPELLRYSSREQVRAAGSTTERAT